MTAKRSSLLTAIALFLLGMGGLVPTASAQTFSISGTVNPAVSGSGATVTLSGTPVQLVQSAPASALNGNSSATVSFGAASASGNTIVLFTRIGGTTVTSVTDNQTGGSNTYTSVVGPTQWGVAPNATDRFAQVFLASNIPGGSTLTITVTLAGSSSHYIYLAALEYSGVDPVNPVNATALGTGTVSANGAPATANLTTTVANAKLVATSWDSNGSYTATGNGSGYTTNTAVEIPGGSGWANLTEDRTAAAAGTYNATASSAPAVIDWVIQLIALAPASSQATATVPADANGNYIFTGLSNGNYTVTPTKSGLTFSPANQVVTVNNANVTGVNFMALYSLSGTITGGAGATAALSGSANATVTADTSGNYSFIGLANGTYTVTPSNSGTTFSPLSQTVTINNANLSGVNFVAATYSISGTISPAANGSGATMTLSGAASATGNADSSGNYSFSLLANGSYTLTPSKTGFSFSPPSQTVTVNGGNVTSVNFTASAVSGSGFSLSGTISPSASGSGATVTLGGVPLLVQSAGQATALGSTSATVTFGSASAAGDTIVLFARFGGAPPFTITGVSDNQSGGSNTYASVLGPTNWTVGLDHWAQVFVVNNVIGGSQLTITVNFSGSTTHHTYLAALEYSGVDHTNPVNATAAGAGTFHAGQPSTSPATPNLTTTVINAKLVATAWDDNDSFTSTGNGPGYTTDSAAGITSIAGGLGWANLTEDATAATAGTYNATASSPNVTDWVIQLVALTPAGPQPPATVTADSSGNYIFSNLADGSYTVTPSKTGLTFGPASQLVTVNGASLTGINFTASYSISGTIGPSANGSGATVTLSGTATATVTADTSGNYSFQGLPSGSYTVTPSKPGFIFNPVNQPVTVSTASVTGINFTATVQTFSISGTISGGSGATVTLSGAVPVLVQTATGAAPTGSGSGTVSFSAPSAAGNAIVLFLRFGGTTIKSVTDNQTGGSNTYTSVVGPTQWGVAPNPTDRSAQVFVAKNIRGGSALTITVTLAGSSTHDISLAALEYSGVYPVNPVNATALGTGTVSANGAPATANLSTTVPNVKLVATSWDSNESYVATSNGSGYTTNTAAGIASVSGGSGWSNLTEDGTAAVAGTYNATASSAPAVADWVIQLVALAPAGPQPPATVNADGSGNYIFANLADGSYTVTPSKAGLTFGPASQQVTVNGASLTGINFTASYSISGTIGPSANGNGATVTLSGTATAKVIADTSGNYSFQGLPSGSYTVTPSKPGFTFNPVNQPVTVSTASVTGINFNATVQTYSISGTISPAASGNGAKVTLSGVVPVLVQTATGAAPTGSVSGKVSFSTPSAAGDAIVLFLRFGGTTIKSVTDNQMGGGNPYTSVVGPTQWGVAPNPTDRSAQVFVAKNIRGGSKLTITVTLAGNSTHDTYMAALEYSGVNPVNPVNAAAVGAGTVSVNGAPTTANLTTNVPNVKLVATSWDSNESYIATSNGSGYTTNSAAGIASISGGSGWSNLTEDRTAAAARTYNATTSSAPAVVDWVIQLVALAPNTGASVNANASGSYIFNNLLNGSYTVTPSSLGFTFTPASQTVSTNFSNVTGINFTATAVPVVNLSPTSLSFPGQKVGTTSGPQNVNLKNTGKAALSITSIVTSGDFASTTNCGASLAAGASCAISVTFKPTATGTRTGTVRITDNAAGSPQTVSLAGTGN